MKRQFPTKDTDIVNKNEILDRIESIDRQIDKIEHIETRTMDGFDKKHAKLTKLNMRKDILWRKMDIILSVERVV